VPRPIQSDRRYLAGLDGIRALAVVFVIAYHLGVPGAEGGMLGVGVFFTLSGYLITDLLLAQWRRHATFELGTFWLRRARRLLPALFVMLAIVTVWVAVLDASQLDQVRRQVVSAALYYANWSTIVHQGSYFARFAVPLPLEHLWSLSIEEQFYLVWPWLLLVMMRVARGRRDLLLMTIGLAVASALGMGLLFHPGYDPTRAYEGTDTRAFTLLIGAALAIVWPTEIRRRVAVNLPVRNLLDGVACLGGGAIVVLVVETDAFSGFLYPYGFLLLSFATAAVVAAVVHPASRVGAFLGRRPLRWVGVRSYGIYLWQWPIIALATSVGQSPGPVRGALAVASTLLIASVSWRFVEEPVRHGAVGRWWRQLRTGAAGLSQRSLVPALSGATALATVSAAALGLTGALPVASASLTGTSVAKIASVPRLTAIRSPRYAPHVRQVGPLANETSCRAVAYIGDSTSEGEISSDYIPDPRLRLPAQLADVGVRTTIPEISAARAIIETFKGHPSGAMVARDLVNQGFHGCWILALGTNEVDNAQAGGPGFQTRIHRMMSIIGRQPVVWVDSITLLPPTTGYAEAGMERWNETLLADCSAYPMMRVFDWSAYARRNWFIPDGIHYYSPGYVARSHDIALGLAHAFPADGPPNPRCLVQ
jgi:peptidoglycan/LPS O-acetylase OafA/YrhL